MKKLLAVLLCVGLVGCATIDGRKLDSLSLGMSKNEVVKILGPLHQRAMTKNPNGDIVQTYEFYSYAPLAPTANYMSGDVTYWLQFTNNKLVFWGLPGDYSSGADKNINVNITNRN